MSDSLTDTKEKLEIAKEAVEKSLNELSKAEVDFERAEKLINVAQKALFFAELRKKEE